MIFHENRLLADDSHEISYLIFLKVGKLSSAAVVIGATISIVTVIMEKLYNLYVRVGNVRCCENSTYHMNKCFTSLTLKTKK